MIPVALEPVLTDLYATLTSHQPTMHPELTALVLETVHATLDPAEIAGYPDMVRVFVEVEWDNLAYMIRAYGPGGAFDNHKTWGQYPYDLVRSPAVLAVCERLSTRPLAFEAAWNDEWESDAMLDDVSSLWGGR